MPGVLVTGANGFVATGLLPRLLQDGYEVRAAVRERVSRPPVGGLAWHAVEDGWKVATEGVSAVVHLAGRAHQLEPTGRERELFRRDNVDLALEVYEAARAAGVGRFVLMSSVKAVGEGSADPSDCYDETSPCRPVDPYGETKLEAERALRAASKDGGPELVILRPPVVYGPGVKGNILRLLDVIAKGRPLPFGAVRNARSIVALENLSDAIVHLLEQPVLRHDTFFVADGAPVSTPDLIREIAGLLGRPARLLPVPPSVLRAAAAMAGRKVDADRLLMSLVVDDKRLRATGWVPPTHREGALRALVDWYIARR